MNNRERNTYVCTQILCTLLQMLETQDIHSISISSLVSKAEVGRASFYRNYQSKEDVLHKEAERLNKELEVICKNDDPNDFRLKLIRIIDFYKAHSDFYMTIYNAGFEAIIKDSIIDVSLLESLVPVAAYTLSAFLYMIYGWVLEWLRRGMKESSDEMIAMFEQMQK